MGAQAGLDKSLEKEANKVKVLGFEIKEYNVGGEIIPRIIAYVKHGEKIHDIYVDSRPSEIASEDGRKKFLAKLLEALNSKIPIYNNMEILVELTTDKSIFDKLREAFNEYRARKVGVRIEEFKIPIPEKTRVFIEKEIARLDRYMLIVYELGKGYKKIGPLDPMTYSSIRRADKSTMFIQLKLGDMDPGKAKIMPQPTPWIHFYKSNNMIIISYEPLRLGENELRLLPVDQDFIDKILDKLTLSDKAILLKSLKKVLVKVSSDEKISDREEAITNELRQLIIDNIEKFVLAETGLDRETTSYLVGNYAEYVDKVLSNLEGDELVINFYKAMSLPYFEALYTPHTLIATSTNAGKTLLYTLLVDEKGPFTRITSMTLVGGIGPDKKPVKGVLDKRQYAIQIESLEEEESKRVLSYLVDYMKSGRAVSGVYGKVIRAEGSAPVILTANIIKRGRAYTIQDWIRKGLLDNPEALGSRLLFFYKDTRQLRIRNRRELFEASTILRELFRSTSVKKRLRSIWENDRIREWLEDPDSLDININETEKELSVLHHYLDVLAKNFYRKLKGLALNTALFDMLDEVYSSPVEDIIDQVLEKAGEYYEYYREELRKSIINVLEEIIIKDPTSLALSLPKYLQLLIIGISEYANEKALILEDKLTVKIEDLIEMMKAKGIIKTEKRIYKYHVLKQIEQYNKELRNLGIFRVDDSIVVDMNSFNMIAVEELALNER